MRLALTLSITLFSACSSKPAVEQSAPPPSRRVIAYIANISPTGEFCQLPNGCRWRMVDPRSGHDELIMTLASIPLNSWWDPGFTEIHYRLGDKLYRAAWKVGAKPEEVVTVPATLAQKPETIVDIWQDATNGKWRIKSLEYEGPDANDDANDDANRRAFAGIWEYSKEAGKWASLDRAPTECECGDCPCAEVMNTWVQSVPRAPLRELLDNMRVAQHLERAQPGEEWQEGRRAFISMTFPDTSYEFDLVVGDSYHAMAPFMLNRGGGKEPQTIYAKGTTCGDQLAFQEEEGFLLLTAEYTGSCARLVNLLSGQIVATLPNTAVSAAWVNRPQQ